MIPEGSNTPPFTAKAFFKLGRRYPVACGGVIHLTQGPKIFPPRQRQLRILGQLFGYGKYSDRNLRQALTDQFGNRTVADLKSLICIPSHSITAGRPYIFKFDHVEGNLGRDNKTPLVDVALATSAAPTYFPIVEIENHGGQFIDGGVCANNPSLVGLLEALKHFVGADKKYQSAKLLSIETIAPKSGLKINNRLRRNLLSWNDNLISVFMEGQSRLTDYSLELFSQSQFIPFNYVRVRCPDVSPIQASTLALDNASSKALTHLVAFGSDQAHLYGVKPEVIDFFKTKKTYYLGGKHG